MAERRRTRRVAGLRTRLALALVATSVATLLVASLALLPPLEQRLERNRFSDLRQLARTTRLALRELPDRTVAPGSPGARTLLVQLQRRTGARVALYAEDGEPLVETDAAARAEEGLAAVRAAGLKRREDVREGVIGDDAVVVAGVRRPGEERLVLVLRKGLRDTRAAAGEVRHAALVAAAAGTVVALLLALALSGRLLSRLGRLRDDARALGDEGLSHRVAVGPPDEVGEVAAAMERMRARLVEQEAARQAFLATASHELRTPLATLQANLELLAEDLSAHGVEAPLRARADASLGLTHRLVGLSTDLLDLSRLDGEIPLSAEPVELAELTGLLRGEAETALSREGRALAVEGGSVHALADPNATQRILRILLDNAAAYGEGDVTVTLDCDEGHARVRVADAGPGIASDERDRIFERFERGAASLGRSGFGLGLPLARGLAEGMGGTLEAEEVGRGALLVLRLPGWSPGTVELEPVRSAPSGDATRRP